MNSTPQTPSTQPNMTGTPGNRAGAAHPYPSSSAVTPNTHASSSSSFQEDEQFGYGTHDARNEYRQGKPHPNMPAILEENGRHPPPPHNMEGDYRNGGFEPNSYPNAPGRRDPNWNYPRHPYPERAPDGDRPWNGYEYEHEQAQNMKQGPVPPNGPPPPSNHHYGGNHYYGDQAHPQSNQPPYDRNYRANGDYQYYGDRPHPQDQEGSDRYMPPPPYHGGPGPNQYMPSKSESRYPPYPNDQVIFRNSHYDSYRPHPGNRSDDIYSFVPADEPSRYNNDHRRHPDYDNHNGGPMKPANVHSTGPAPHYDSVPHDRTDHASPYEYPPPPQDDVIHMVSPHRRGRMLPPDNHQRQFSSESETFPPYDYRHNMPPIPYTYPPTSPMRRPYPHSHPQPIPIALTNSNSFESSNRSNTPPPVPQAVHPTCQSIAEVNSDDVLCGRGGGTNSQIGNRRFRKLVQDYQPEYLVARRKAKPQISRTIVQVVRKRGGRFLRKEEATGFLYEVGDERAEAKTSQALREGLDVRACAGGKKKTKESEEQGRETPTTKNEGDRKRTREEEDSTTSTTDTNTKPDGKSWQEFSPPKTKAKLDCGTDEETKEEEKTDNSEQTEVREEKESFPENWSATAV